MNPFGELGVWTTRQVDEEEHLRVAREAEALGYGTVWIGGGGEPGVFDLAELVLGATERIVVATGIVNIWTETPQSVTRAWHALEERYPGRLYVGLGISHSRIVDGLGQTYDRPLARTREFLDALDAETDPLPADRRILAALGPKMLALAAERTLGTHPYLTTTANTAAARAGVGPDKVVATELGAVLDPDRDSARRQGQDALSFYVGLPNYANNWRRSGFTDDDFDHGASPRLADALLALGDRAAVAARIDAHRDAGADHVCIQVLGDDPDRAAVLRALAPEQGGS